MRRILLPIVVLALIAGASQALAGTTYGKPLTIEAVTPIGDILDKPEAFVGKAVKVRGMVVDVCPTRGCWMDLAGDKSQQKIRIKVEDGVMVFPPSARGKQALVQGTVEAVQLCPDEARRMKEKGAAAAAGIYTILPTGAVID